MITNIHQSQLMGGPSGAAKPVVRVNGRELGTIGLTFGDVDAGEPLALIGSSGLLEIAVNRGRAVDRFGPAGEAVVEVVHVGK